MLRVELVAAWEALAVAVVAIADEPRPPIFLTWGDLGRRYDSLNDLGMDLQFVLEREYLAPGEPRPIFSDRDGRRFRILVVSLEVVLCVLVPNDFEPEQLELQPAHVDGAELLIESLHGVPHRALSRASGSALPIDGIPLGVISAESSLAELHLMSAWLEFDQAWVESVDPAPPISLVEWARRRLVRLLRGRKL